MKRAYSTVLSSLVLSGAVFVMAPQAWSQAGGASGSGSKSDPSASGSSSQRSGAGSSSEMQSQREQGSAARTSGSRMSKEDVKQVQAALKNKGMDPGPEDGVLGPKTQQALREFQKSNNLTATGRIDEKTASALGVDVGGSSATGAGSSSSTGAGSSSGTSGTGSKSGASQSSSGSKAGSTANPPSKPMGKD